MSKKKPIPLDPSAFRQIMSGLLILNAILHLGVALLGVAGDLRTPLLVFGLIYAGLGAWVRGGGRAAVLMGLVFAALGLGLGGVRYFEQGGPVLMPLMFLLDILVLVAGGVWLTKSRSGKKA